MSSFLCIAHSGFTVPGVVFDCLGPRCTRELVKEGAVGNGSERWHLVPTKITHHLNYPQRETGVLLGRCVCVETVGCWITTK